MADTGRRNPKDLRCSLCGKSRERVRRLIAGRGVHICDECLSLCNEIIAGDGPDRPRPSGKPAARSRRLWVRRLLHLAAPA